MTNLRQVPRDQDAEALYWLDVAKRVLGGELSPDEALHSLKMGTCLFRKLYPDILVMEPSQDRNGDYSARPLDR